MRIVSSTVALGATHQSIQSRKTEERLDVWSGGPPRAGPLGRGRGPRGAPEVSLSESARKGMNSRRLEAREACDGAALPGQSLRIQLLQRLVEMFTGRALEVFDPRELSEGPAAGETETSDASDTAVIDTAPQAGLRYEYREVLYEREQMHFEAAAIVQTADGAEIRVDVELNMSREFYSETSLVVEAGERQDPLVVNFDGPAAALTERRFAFDIDVDGESEQIAFVMPGSGFLAIDHNGDGEINDGSELFGPTTGHGFDELAAYDSDANGWIDETDPVYERLRIWTRDENGQSSLFALGQKGVGAVYLGHVSSPFNLRNDANQEVGVVTDTGLFVGEDGEAGTVQQVDLIA
jgi:hypothetical protein